MKLEKHMIDNMYELISQGKLNDFDNLVDNEYKFNRKQLYFQLEEEVFNSKVLLKEQIGSSDTPYTDYVKSVNKLYRIQDALLGIIGYEGDDYRFNINESEAKHFKQQLQRGFMCVSAYRPVGLPSKINGKEVIVTGRINFAQHRNLMSILHQTNLDKGAIVTLGYWEGDKELSVFVPFPEDGISEEDFYELAKSLCKKFDQDCVIIKLPSETQSKFIYQEDDDKYIPGPVTYNPKEVVKDLKIQCFTRFIKPLKDDNGEDIESYVLGTPIYLDAEKRMHRYDENGHIIRLKDNGEPDGFAYKYSEDF